MTAPRPTRTPAQIALGQAITRGALLTGVLGFGAIGWFVHRQPGWTPTVLPPAILWVCFAIAVAAVLVGVRMRTQLLATRDPAKRGGIRIIGWAIGELAALLGGGFFLLNGDVRGYVAGLIAMAATFVLLPVRQDT